MRLARTITVLLLTGILTMPFLAYLFLQLKTSIARYEMEEKLEQFHLETITVPANAIKWHKKSKEIIIDGRLFDVKSYTIKSNIAVFTGLFDEKETRIKQQLEKLHDQTQTNGAAQVCKYTALLLYCNDLHSYQNENLQTRILSAKHFVRTEDFTSAFISISSPPPRLA